MTENIEIQTKINDLRSLETDQINHFQYSKKSKIPLKAHLFVETMNCRMIDFCDSTSQLLASNHIVPALALIRSVIENTAITFCMKQDIETSINSGIPPENIDDKWTRLSFGVKYDPEMPPESILTLIEKLDKKYPNIKDFYATLCEFVHPNWDGVQGSYSESDELTHTTSIQRVICYQHPLYKWIESCFLLILTLYLDFVKSIKEDLVKFTYICENNC